MLKAIKNQVEQEGFRKAMIHDGIAWVKTLRAIEEKLNSDKRVTEKDIATLFSDFRSLSPLYKGESFAPIVAFGSNAALPHYSPSSEDVLISNNISELNKP